MDCGPAYFDIPLPNIWVNRDQLFLQAPGNRTCASTSSAPESVRNSKSNVLESSESAMFDHGSAKLC